MSKLFHTSDFPCSEEELVLLETISSPFLHSFGWMDILLMVIESGPKTAVLIKSKKINDLDQSGSDYENQL